jgi:hypothetical protein
MARLVEIARERGELDGKRPPARLMEIVRRRRELTAEAVESPPKFNAEAEKHKPPSEEHPKKGDAREEHPISPCIVPEEEPEGVVVPLEFGEDDSKPRRKTFRDKQIERLEDRMWTIRQRYRARVPDSASSAQDWLRNELRDIDTCILPLLDIGAKSVSTYDHSESYVSGYRNVPGRQICLGLRVDTKEPVISGRDSYNSHNELAMKMRHSGAYKLLATVSVIWTLAYFGGFPPPQRLFFPDEASKSIRLEPCGPAWDRESVLPNWLQSDIINIMCAEAKYRANNKSDK